MIITAVLIIIVIIISVVFFRLSKKHNKNIFLYPILGVLVFVIGVGVYILLYAVFIKSVSHINRYVHEFLCFSIGLLCAYILCYFLNKRWNKIR